MPKPSKPFLLYADIVGSTKILQQDKTLALERLDQFKEILQEKIKTLYQRYIGQYGEARVWEEDGQLFYKRSGLARRIFLPISDQEFIPLYAYGFKYKFDIQEAIVKGINLYNYGNENETRKLTEDWYYERTKLKN